MDHFLYRDGALYAEDVPVAEIAADEPVLAWASVVDNQSNDPTTILPVLGGSERVILLEIGSIQGIDEFSGSASITNYSGRQAMVRADFLQRGVGGGFGPFGRVSADDAVEQGCHSQSREQRH